jgi:ABC-2 type transport system ATP-binding protein
MEALSIQHLVKTYRNGFTALKSIDLCVEAGDFFALLGPNGAGKTTLIGIITSLVNKTSGKVRVFGDDLDQDPETVKAHIGIVPQEFNMFIFDKAESVLITQAGYYGIPRKIAKQRAEKYLKLLDLWDMRHKTVQMLSGGMKRRLMIARALMHEPRLLILDEPTAGVDIEIRRAMWKFLKEINEQGTTIILTTHYLEEAENLCRRVAIIDRGEIIANTSVNELLATLQMETFVFRIKESMNILPVIQDFTCRLMDAHCLEVDIIGGQSLNDLFVQLIQMNLHVLSIRTKVNRLEELFIKLTAREEE